MMSEDDIVLKSGSRTLSRKELDAQASRAATILKEAGVSKGDVVALLLRNDFQYFILAEAVRYMGAGVTPVNWHLTPPEIDYILKDCGAKVLVAHADLYSDVLRALCSDITVFVEDTPTEISEAYKLDTTYGRKRHNDRFLGVEIKFANPQKDPIGPPTPALFYTSGTTGKPKAVVKKPIPKEAAMALGARSAFAFGLQSPGARAVMTGPLYHSAPNAYALYVVRKEGMLVLQPKFDSVDLMRIIEADKITNMNMVPTMFQRMLALPEAERSKYDLTSLKHVVHSAAPCPADVKQRMIDWLGEVVHEYYAMTEVGIIACSSSREWLENKGTVGHAPSGVDIEIRDDQGIACEKNVPGNICIRHEATHAFTYHQAGGKADEMRQDGFVVTGDVGYLNENGFLFINDRKTDMILSGGVNIYPAEIEAALAEMNEIRDSAVFGVPHKEFGESVVAIVETDASLNEKGIKVFLQDRLAKFKLPRNFKFTTKLPREDSGKIKKRVLRDQYLDEQSS